MVKRRTTLARMSRATLLFLLVVMVTTTQCRQHPYAAEWEASYDECVSDGLRELTSRDIGLVRDVCSRVIADLSGEYPDTHPDDIPASAKGRVFDEAFDDCRSQDLLESKPC